jgi:hypothetical protein
MAQDNSQAGNQPPSRKKRHTKRAKQIAAAALVAGALGAAGVFPTQTATLLQALLQALGLLQ